MLLGRFAVERGGMTVTPPAGHPSLLVKLVALHGPLAADEAIEALWPDVDAMMGRRRLRNLLNRVKMASGELVVRERGSLRLIDGVEVDLVRFDAAADLALRHPGAAAVETAVALYRGELLPEDRYDDWSAAERERLRRRHLDVLDAGAECAHDRGDLAEACRLLDISLQAEPLDERRAVLAARLLAERGRLVAANDVLRRTVRSLAGLGLAPGDELVAALAAAPRPTVGSHDAPQRAGRRRGRCRRMPPRPSRHDT